MQCLPQSEEWVVACRSRDVKARVENTKVSEGHGLEGVPRHGTVVKGRGRSGLGLKMAAKHMSNIMMQVRRRLGRKGRVTKIIVLQVSVVSVFIEKALETDVHGPGAKFVLPGSRMAGDTRGVFFALAGMKARADQLEIGNRRELEGAQVRGVLWDLHSEGVSPVPQTSGGTPP